MSKKKARSSWVNCCGMLRGRECLFPSLRAKQPTGKLEETSLFSPNVLRWRNDGVCSLFGFKAPPLDAVCAFSSRCREFRGRTETIL